MPRKGNGLNDFESKDFNNASTLQLLKIFIKLFSFLYSRVIEKIFKPFQILSGIVKNKYKEQINQSEKLALYNSKITGFFSPLSSVKKRLLNTEVGSFFYKIYSLHSKKFSAALVFLLILIVGIFNKTGQDAFSATFGWLQNSWAGGIDTVNFGGHANRGGGWTKFFSKDDGIIISGDSLRLAQTNNTWVDTTASEFALGSKNNTFVSSTGNFIMLLKPLNASCGHDTECNTGICDSFVCVPRACNGETSITYSGQTYQLVDYGRQCWLKQNLNVGTKLAAASTNPSNNNVIEKWCFNDFDTNNGAGGCSTGSSSGGGGLYNWSEALQLDPSCQTTSCSFSGNRQGICPAGWHIPSDSEFKILEMFLGMSQSQADLGSWRGTTEGTALKTGGVSGFDFLLAGYMGYAVYSYNGVEGMVWTTYGYTTNRSYARRVNSSEARVSRSDWPKEYGFAVRCIKDRGLALGNSCSSGSQCASGFCQTTCKVPTGNSCSQDSECATNNKCVAGVCRANNGSACSQNTDCRISEGATCVSSVCKAPVGVSCSASSECITNYCDGTNKCAYKTNGMTCGAASECLSNACVASTCVVACDAATPCGDTCGFGTQVYPTSKIGNLCWFTKNLNSSVGSCYNNNSSNCTTYGKLIDWSTALSACPTGWHLPTDGEFKQIASNPAPSVFNALYGGYHMSGTYYSLGSEGSWWTASDGGNTGAAKAVYSGGNLSVTSYSYQKIAGFSVRCVKNQVAVGQACSNHIDCVTGNCLSGTCQPWVVNSNCGFETYYQDSSNTTWGPYNSYCSSPYCTGTYGNAYLVSDNSVNFTSYPARNACKTLGGRLPTPDELNCLYTNRNSYGIYTINTSVEYWSSRQYDQFGAYTFYTPNGSTINRHKTNSYPVRCVRDVSCSTDSDCLVTGACFNNTCVAKQATGGSCNTNADCTNNNCYVYMVGTCGANNASCTSDSHCTSGACGVGNTCVAKQSPGGSCNSNGDCSSNNCYLATQKCGDIGAGCGGDTQCTSGACYNALCIAKRSLNGQCDSGPDCVGNVCSLGNCKAADGESCSSDSDCGGGACGVGNTCIAKQNPGGSCNSNPDCTYNNCNLSTSKCGDIGTSCTNDIHCSSGACYQGSCVAKRGYDGACDSGGDCTTNACSASNVCRNALYASCTQDDQCVSGACGVDSTCINPQSNGTSAYCNTNADCSSQTCDSQGYCGFVNGATCSVSSQCISDYCNSSFKCETAPAPVGSCPYLYAWNGTEYEYITDFQGKRIGFSKWDPTNYIPAHLYYIGDHFPSVNGKYQFKIRETIHESDFFDYAELWVADVPKGYQVYSDFHNTYNIKGRSPGINLFTVKPRAPISAVNKYGVSVLNEVLTVDDVPAKENASSTNYYTFDFGKVDNPQNAKLIVHGWQLFKARDVKGLITYPSNADGTAQNTSIEVMNAEGKWQKVKEFGDMLGDTEPVVFDISNIWLTDDHRIRLHPSYRFDSTLIIDKIEFDESEPVPFELKKATPAMADLHFRGTGYVKNKSFNNSIVAYDNVIPTNEDALMYGFLTKYGEVTPLLTKDDDKFVIMRHGDEITMEFDEPAQTPSTDRKFFYLADVFYSVKIHPTGIFLSDTVDPLPFHGMTSYPYDTSKENYPYDADHIAYIKEWNTRYCGKGMGTNCETRVPTIPGEDVKVQGVWEWGILSK